VPRLPGFSKQGDQHGAGAPTQTIQPSRPVVIVPVRGGSRIHSGRRTQHCPATMPAGQRCFCRLIGEVAFGPIQHYSSVGMATPGAGDCARRGKSPIAGANRLPSLHGSVLKSPGRGSTVARDARPRE